MVVSRGPFGPVTLTANGMPTSHPRPHHLSRSLSGCQQRAAKRVPRGLGVRGLRVHPLVLTCFSFLDVSFVAAESLPSRKPLQTLGSSFGRIGFRLCACAAKTQLSSTPLILARVVVEPRSVRINGGPCTICRKSGENTCAWTGSARHLHPVFSDTRAAAA